jgi:hypothetical protein
MSAFLYNIVFGSNRFLGTSGIIIVNGKELLKIDTIPFGVTYKPLFSVEIRDSKNKLLGKLYKSTSFVHVDPEYEAEIVSELGYPRRLALKSKEEGKYVFELNYKQPNEVEINGVFYVKDLSYPIIATKDYLDINTNKFIGNTKINNGSGIIINKNSIAI